MAFNASNSDMDQLHVQHDTALLIIYTEIASIDVKFHAERRGY